MSNFQKERFIIFENVKYINIKLDINIMGDKIMNSKTLMNINL